MSMPFVLVMAKAPVPGFAKTRLCPPATPEQAALLAAASLLDTLDAALATTAPVVVALAGDIPGGVTSGDGAMVADVRRALRRVDVIRQRGDHLGERLAHAHADAARLRPGAPVLQIGMDTPQVTPHGLSAALALLATPTSDVVSPAPHVVSPAGGGVRAHHVDVALGTATDGGWWALGLRDPAHAAVLTGVPMSTSETGACTRLTLLVRGLRIAELPVLSDVDTMTDAVRVATDAPGSRFAQTLGDVIAVRAAPEATGGRT